MKKGNTGGDSTKTGIEFEKNTDLKTALTSVPGYEVDMDGKVFIQGIYVADLCAKYQFYKRFLEPRGVQWSGILSKRLLPDEALCVHKSKRVFIVEKKWQETEGSVDEKLQTCHFKKRQYAKLVNPTGYSVEYLFVLNHWFRKNRYRDVFEYIDEVGCKYYFGEVPLGFFFPSK